MGSAGAGRRAKESLYVGSVGLRLLPHKLRQWHPTAVADLCVTHAPRRANPACRCLSLPGPTADQMYLLSLNELFLPQDLLTSAGLLLEVEAMRRRPHCR